MSILIKGMEMPKRCLDCPCFDYEYAECQAHGTATRENGCPLVEVPEPHGRLVDADFMKELGAKCIARRCDDGVLLALGGIDDLPTVIEAEG